MNIWMYCLILLLRKDLLGSKRKANNHYFYICFKENLNYFKMNISQNNCKQTMEKKGD